MWEDVIKHKSVFYNSPYANYEMCTAGKLKLIPTNATGLNKLASDLGQMIATGMFYAEPPSFEKTLDKLQRLEQKINS